MPQSQGIVAAGGERTASAVRSRPCQGHFSVCFSHVRRHFLLPCTVLLKIITQSLHRTLECAEPRANTSLWQDIWLLDGVGLGWATYGECGEVGNQKYCCKESNRLRNEVEDVVETLENIVSGQCVGVGKRAVSEMAAQVGPCKQTSRVLVDIYDTPNPMPARLR